MASVQTINIGLMMDDFAEDEFEDAQEMCNVFEEDLLLGDDWPDEFDEDWD